MLIKYYTVCVKKSSKNGPFHLCCTVVVFSGNGAKRLVRSVVYSVLKFLRSHYTPYAIAHEVEGLAAGKLVAGRQYRCTCGQSSPNCDLCPAEKHGTQAETERKTAIKQNGECYKQKGEG